MEVVGHDIATHDSLIEQPAAPPSPRIAASAVVNGSVSGPAEEESVPKAEPKADVIPKPEVKLADKSGKPAVIGLASFDSAEAAATKKRVKGWIWAVAAVLIGCAGGGAVSDVVYTPSKTGRTWA